MCGNESLLGGALGSLKISVENACADICACVKRGRVSRIMGGSEVCAGLLLALFAAFSKCRYMLMK